MEKPPRGLPASFQVDEWKEERKITFCYANQRYYIALYEICVLDLVYLVRRKC